MFVFRLPWSLPLVLVTAVGCSPKGAPEPVRIGQLLPLSGPNRTIGQHARQGVELAVAEFADKPLAGHPFAVLHVDSRSEAETVRAETVRLLTVNKTAALVGGFDAALSEALLRANQPYGVPVIVPGELAAESNAAQVRSLAVSAAVRGRLLAAYANTDLRLKRAAVVTDGRLPAAVALSAAFVKAWPRGDASIEEWTFATAAEREERIGRALAAAPAVVVLACSVADFRALRSRVTAALPKASLIYGGPDAGAAPLQAELEARSDVYLATAYDADHLSEIGRDFAKSYQERFHEPPDLYAAQAYDAARLLLQLMHRAGSASKEALRKELEKLDSFDSVTGSLHWKEHQPSRRVFLVALKNHRAKVVRAIEPEENR